MVDLFLLMVISQIATQVTHALSLHRNVGGVRASSFVTLAFIAVTYPFDEKIIPIWHSAVLGSSFVGMTDPARLSREHLVMASVIFCFIFHFLIKYIQGPGGALGISALLSCLTTYSLVLLNAHIRKT